MFLQEMHFPGSALQIQEVIGAAGIIWVNRKMLQGSQFQQNNFKLFQVPYEGFQVSIGTFREYNKKILKCLYENTMPIQGIKSFLSIVGWYVRRGNVIERLGSKI